ncbi:MAG: histidine triad nucleotide-binding protein [Patescibacteria group bacterium]
MKDCIFCKIINKEIDSEILYEDTDMIVVKDIRPKAPVHILIIPKKHIESFKDVTKEDSELIGKLMLKAKEMAEEQGIAESGYKVVINSGKEGGQIIYHLHVHLLGGEPLMGVV